MIYLCTETICDVINFEYLWNEGRYSVKKRETPIFLSLKGLSKLFFTSFSLHCAACNSQVRAKWLLHLQRWHPVVCDELLFLTLLMFCSDKEDFYSNQLQNAATETSTEIRCKEDGSNHQTFPEFTTPTSDSTQLENTKETNRITSQVTAYGVIYEELAKARASSSAEASNEGVATLEEKTSSCPILSGICRMWDFN